MAKQKILDLDLLNGLAKIFRSKGYDGANLSELSIATNLKKASLYHRFPDGKQEMAETVLIHIEEWVDKHIFEPLENKEILPQKRLQSALVEIYKSYNGGKDNCIFRSLSLDSGNELFQERIGIGIKKWIHAFEKFGLTLNFTEEKAHKYALQTLIEIQGSLVLTKGLNSTIFFEETLKRIENRYLKE